MNLKELLESKLKTATEIHMTRYDVDSKEYGVLVDNMLKTVQLLNYISGAQKINNDAPKNKIELEEKSYRERWLGESVDDLKLEAARDMVEGVIALTSTSCPSCENLINRFFPTIKSMTNLLNIDVTEDPDILFDLGMKNIPILLFIKDKTITYLQLGFDNDASEKGAANYIRKLIKTHVY